MRTLLSLALLFTVNLFAQTNHWETAVYEDDVWRYRVPTTEPDTNWRKVSFNASSWQQGQGGFGFGDNDDNTVINQSVSCYIRITFNITDTSKISEAVLNADYDDGYVAYLNNVEISRAGVNGNGPPPWNTLAGVNHEAVMYSGGDPDYVSIPGNVLDNILLPGLNVLCVQIHNVTANSSDLTGRFWLSFGITDASVLFGPTPSWFVAPLNFTSSDLPIVVINTNTQTIVDDPKIMCDLGIIYNGPGNRNYLTDPFNEFNGTAGVELRGSSSQYMFPKKSYGIELWDVNGNAINSPLLGMPSESDWILSANHSDKSFLNNFLAYSLARSMGWYAPRCQHVELVINGEYRGVYVFMEKIKKDNGRVDISTLQPTDIYGSDVTGGYIIKIDKTTGSGGDGWMSSFAPDTAPSGQYIYYQYEYPADSLIVPQQEAYIQAFVDSFETALAGPNFADPVVGYAKYIDVNSFVDYFLLNEISRNVDGYRLSTYLYKQKDTDGNKLVIGPVWDYDIAWGNANYCAGNDTTGWAIDFALHCDGDFWQIPFWWDRLLEDTAFQNKVRCRWEELSQTVLSVAYLHNFCDSMGLYLNEGQGRNFQKWPILGTYVWPNPAPYPATYQGEINELKDWITARHTWMDNHMPGTLNGCNLTSSPDGVSGASQIDAYPNPFNAEILLSVYLLSPSPVSIRVYNALGQEVMPVQQVNGNTGSNQIRVQLPETLPKGIYTFHVSQGDKSWVVQGVKTDNE